MRALARRLDRHLRRRLELVELTDDPDCLFRVRLTEATHELSVPGGAVPQGSPVCELHFWNEHVPRLARRRSDLEWGVRAARQVRGTFRLIARELETRPELRPARAVGGTTAIVFPGGGRGAEQLLARLGFEVVPHVHPWGRFFEFWESVYTWILMWTFNPGAVRGRPPSAIRRSEVWMSREQFLERYGDGGSAAGPALGDDREAAS